MSIKESRFGVYPSFDRDSPSVFLGWKITTGYGDDAMFSALDRQMMRDILMAYVELNQLNYECYFLPFTFYLRDLDQRKDAGWLIEPLVSLIALEPHLDNQ